MVSGSITKVSAAAALLCLAGCRGAGPAQVAVLGEAYVGPPQLSIRREISLQSPAVATVRHGDRLEILQQRRVFYRVRTPGGSEGWTSGSQLLSSSDMDGLRELTRRAARLPVQGEAVTYDTLRVHAQPSARSPGVVQIAANEKFAVLGHVVAPRIDLPRVPLIRPAPRKKAAPKKPAKPSARISPPPLPPPPPLPRNWQELSKPALDDPALAAPLPEAAPAESAPASPAPPVVDDWSLVRTADGQTGWALTRHISMAIPDEVAQYAEGRRIVSYFSLGTVEDGDARKHIWLWTTAPEGHPGYDFGSFRVFVWSLRRHRYETAYIERNIQGYEPVLLQQTSYAGSVHSRDAPEKYPGFSICLRKQDGSLVRRDYVLLTNVVRLAGERACELPPPLFSWASAGVPGGPAQAAHALAPVPESRGAVQKLKETLRRWWRRH